MKRKEYVFLIYYSMVAAIVWGVLLGAVVFGR